MAQKRFQSKDGWLYLMLTISHGFGLGFFYRTFSFELWLGSLVIDFTVPTPLWWRMRQADRLESAKKPEKS